MAATVQSVGCEIVQAYISRFGSVLKDADWSGVERLADALYGVWERGATVFLCGNGGSAANAAHLAVDLLYGVAPSPGKGLRAHALVGNVSVLTCLGNDTGYEKIFSNQLRVQGKRGDLLVVMSGSGNSPNVVEALKVAQELGLETAGILGFSGGVCKGMVDIALHFAVDDMQISEDLQIVVGHMVTRILKERVAQCSR